MGVPLHARKQRHNRALEALKDVTRRLAANRHPHKTLAGGSVKPNRVSLPHVSMQDRKETDGDDTR